MYRRSGEMPDQSGRRSGGTARPRTSLRAIDHAQRLPSFATNGQAVHRLAIARQTLRICQEIGTRACCLGKASVDRSAVLQQEADLVEPPVCRGSDAERVAGVLPVVGQRQRMKGDGAEDGGQEVIPLIMGRLLAQALGVSRAAPEDIVVVKRGPEDLRDGDGRDMACRPGAVAGALLGRAGAPCPSCRATALHLRPDWPGRPEERAADGRARRGCQLRPAAPLHRGGAVGQHAVGHGVAARGWSAARTPFWSSTTPPCPKRAGIL